MAQLKNTNIDDTGFITIPSGTTAQRPGSPVEGFIRYNTTLNQLEYYNNGQWRETDGRIQASASGAEKTYNIVENGVPYTVHIFTNEQGAGTFTVTQAGEVEYLIIAGGGGGGAWVGGGGGGGGFLSGKVDLTPGSYPIAVGAGGTRERNPGSYSGMPRATRGGNSTAFGLTSIGGGKGGSWSTYDAGTGGSGGGEGHSPAGAAGTPGQGFNGGQGRGSSTNGYPTGGGGGAGGVGGNWTAAKSGDGGVGKPSAITGAQVWYSGGGGGGIHGSSSNAQPGNGGKGGGGYGDAPNNGASTGESLIFDGAVEPTGYDGHPNTGGGGGGSGRSGGSASSGGAGGSGIVVIRYKRDYAQVGVLDGGQIELDNLYGASKEGLVYAYDMSKHLCLNDEKWNNRTIRDLSGNSNHATFNNGYLRKDGKNGGGLYFDGSSNLTVSYNAATMDFSRAQTIMMWVTPTTLSGRRNLHDQSYGGSGTWTHEPAGSVSYYFGTNGPNGSPYVGRGSDSGFLGTVNETAFIVSTRNQLKDRMYWYKNGVQYNSATAGGYATTANATTDIRHGVGYTSTRWQGWIYFMAVYTRELSAIEIKQIYDATKWRVGS
jgi:hypothetical protein